MAMITPNYNLQYCGSLKATKSLYHNYKKCGGRNIYPALNCKQNKSIKKHKQQHEVNIASFHNVYYIPL